MFRRNGFLIVCMGRKLSFVNVFLKYVKEVLTLGAEERGMLDAAIQGEA